MTVRFQPTEEQEAFAEVVRDLLQRVCAPDAVRGAWSDPDGWSDQRWRALADLGALGALVPEERGGLGLRLTDLVLVTEAAGYACLPEPLAEVAGVVVPLLVRGGDPLGILPEVTAGTTVVGVGLYADAPALWPVRAEWLLLEHAGRPTLVQANQVRAVPVTSVDRTRRLARIVEVAADGCPLGDSDDLAWARDLGALSASAMLVGLGQRMLDMAVSYARTREQFGVPIGSFQAVKHQLVDASLQLEFARPLVHRAAWAAQLQDGPMVPLRISHAKLAASRAGNRVARAALQVHGAIGYSTEYDLHMWMKRAWALARAWGDSRWHRARVGSLLRRHGPRELRQPL